MAKGKATVEYLKGPVMFARVFEWNLDEGEYAPEGGQYRLDIGLGKDDKKKVLSWNKRYGAKEYKDEWSDGVVEGLDYYGFKRPHVGKLKKLGGPPSVVDADNSDWDEDVAIGNGSICTLKLNVYRGVAGGKPYTSVTLLGIRVDEHVPYEMNDDDDGEDDHQTTDGTDGADDEIPF